MPYATRKMVQYMKDHGMSSNVESKSAASGNDIVSGAEGGGGKKKIRELPSSVDPEDDCSSKKSPDGGGSKTGKPKSAASIDKASSKVSKVSKPKSAASSTGSKTSVSKVKSSAGKSKKSKSEKSNKPVKGSKSKVKVISATAMALKPLTVPGINYDDMTFDQKKVQFLQALLKSNVKKLNEIDASEPLEKAKKEFSMYSIGEKKPLERKPHSAKAMYECRHKSFPDDCLVVAKVYDAKNSEFDAKKSFFLKVLRHLGKKHPNVIQTWDVIANDGSIYVFQELAPYGNMADYMQKKGALDEKGAQEVGKQMRLGMDFLGDMGLAHRAIAPRHVLVLHKDLRIKLTGFRSAIIYYNMQKDDINYQPCIKLSKKGKGEDYNAPEVYGDSKKEEYDPISADVWSAGASLYNFLTGKFPYDNSKNNPKIEDEIQGNVRGLKVSDNAKSALGFMLTTESIKRFSVDRLQEHPWFQEK